MIVTELRGNVRDLDASTKVADRVVFDNESRVKRIQRVTTEGGTELGLKLDKSVRELEDGDILAETDQGVIVASMAPLDVLVIQPASIEEALKVAHSLGNRHLQAQFFGTDSEFKAEVMVVRYDHTVEHHLNHVGVNYHRGDYVMPRAFRHAEHTH
ncbi:urease accessory protein [Corynebacterium mucifaciens]|uniref:Urease accessory protein UreE n=1 Tax=Corynebacterium ureicelerivorans TaxID=401472 RepID=A0A077HJQ5_9CORY|nr:urease accessory protein UreE [Corynebacterium ureicelerivorans]AIL96349.1 Urease accessory protein UreE [Corynebacterium ureicelerivorans]MDN8627274.1 urease accessory protein UreE [Corynebacterium ureicelerivorans]